MPKTLLAWILAIASLAVVGARERVVAPLPETPTFSREIVRILQQHCQECHRIGGIAPFPLMSYADAAPRAHQIAAMTLSRRMPPWKPQPDCGEFRGQRRLSPAALRTIARWVAAGAPEGDRIDLSPPRNFSSGWTLGEPDLVIGMPRVFTPPRDRDSFRCFVLDFSTDQELFVSAVDFRSAAQENVHHVIAYVDDTAAAERFEGLDEAPGYECLGGPRFVPRAVLGGWFPGSEPIVFPEGVAGRFSPGSRIVMQVHYHPHDGVVSSDFTEMAVYLTPAATKTLRYLAAENTTLIIPAGAAAHEVSATVTIPTDIDLHAIGAHMHLLGRTFRSDAELPDGSRRCLLAIDDWDPAWQGMYALRQPLRLPEGTRLTVSATYDNSEANPRNPNSPPKDVFWGEEALSEMLSAYIAYTEARD